MSRNATLFLNDKNVLPRYGLKGYCCEIVTYFNPPAFAHLAAAARLSSVHHCAIKVTKGVEEKKRFSTITTKANAVCKYSTTNIYKH
jgi:hypothetical protein